MDGEPVDEPSERKSNGGGAESSTRKPFTEAFMDVFPQYLAMGMTYDEFWHGHPSLVQSYRRAWVLKREQRNWELWMQGAYIYDALLRVAPVMRAAFGKGRVEPGKYPEQPYPLSEKEARDREEAKRKAAFERALARMIKEAENNKLNAVGVKEDGDD